jgi:hypothetical protein
LSQETFDYPLGIRPWPGLLRVRRNRLREGYTCELLENSSDAYRFTAMLGAGKVVDFVRAFARLLPEEAFAILEFYTQDEEGESQPDPAQPTVFYSPYLPVGELLETLEPYLPRLIHDGFVGFGLANNRAGMELFYSEEKVLTCFTDNHIRLMDLFARHQIPHRENLLFPGDFGHDHLSLLCHHRRSLPEPFASMNDATLDYGRFCPELVELLEMYPVEETLAFFLSRREQDQIEAVLRAREEFVDLAEEDFGALLLDWHDFVVECETGFEGDLWEYQQCLRLRDLIQYVAENAPPALAGKLREIVGEADERFRQLLVDRRKRLDPPGTITLGDERFWCHGVVKNQGTQLRRDLIRQGWFKP